MINLSTRSTDFLCQDSLLVCADGLNRSSGRRRKEAFLFKVNMPAPKDPIKLKLWIEKVVKARKGYRHSQETRDKISRAHKGMVCSEKHKNNLKKNSWMRGRFGVLNPNYKGGEERNKILKKIWRKNHKDSINYRNAMRRARRRNAPGKFTFQEWVDLKKKYKYTCLRCKKQEPDILLTPDHIVPLIKLGSNFITNIQPLCLQCNSSKGGKDTDYRQGFNIPDPEKFDFSREEQYE